MTLWSELVITGLAAVGSFLSGAAAWSSRRNRRTLGAPDVEESVVGRLANLEGHLTDHVLDLNRHVTHERRS